MNGFMLGTSIVLAVAGLLMFVAPERVMARMSLAPLPTDPQSRRIFRIGGGVLIALALVLIIQLLSE